MEFQSELFMFMTSFSVCYLNHSFMCVYVICHMFLSDLFLYMVLKISSFVEHCLACVIVVQVCRDHKLRLVKFLIYLVVKTV